MLKNKTELNNSNVLVIGGAGFIGSNLIDSLWLMEQKYIL